ncbi:MAG: hypothetical protein F6K50_33615 [Moorea sp. SIO3I7]|uniref:hypothetical protein n=2 Tax=unclassified Moorena TaxID=2683338 RepID=UPI0013BF7D54|nr:hypothetical protein [Moorena sp. SIO3I8]NEO00219.1 hypothetical protein [Moorena sp. SIO3I7]NEO09785.1 hypothetical protein [Moorena sp. SIO3I8]
MGSVGGVGRWGDGEMGRWGDGAFKVKFPDPLFPVPFAIYSGRKTKKPTTSHTQHAKLYIDEWILS